MSESRGPGARPGRSKWPNNDRTCSGDGAALGALDVLVVEDDTLAAEGLRMMLEEAGVRSVTLAANGAEALVATRARATCFGLILCDLQMPEMDGLRLIGELAEADCASPIAVISGATPELLASATRLAALQGLTVLDALEKPFKPGRIVHIARAAAARGLPDGCRAPDLARSPGSRSPALSLREKPDLSEELAEAIEAERLDVVYQPKVSVAAGGVVSTEALVRWTRKNGEAVAPATFIPLAEEHGLIDGLTDLVLRRTLRDCQGWRDAGRTWSIAVNLSMTSLHELSLPERISRLAGEGSLPPEAISLEVTETRLMKDLRATLEVLLRLRMHGMRLSIDDFGTGYSTLTQLHGLPFHELKVDRQFVHGAGRDAKARAILETSVDLAEKLGLSVVAEGVEDADDMALVEDLGCDVVQGYYFSRPLPADVLMGAANDIEQQVRARAWAA